MICLFFVFCALAYYIIDCIPFATQNNRKLLDLRTPKVSREFSRQTQTGVNVRRFDRCHIRAAIEARRCQGSRRFELLMCLDKLQFKLNQWTICSSWRVAQNPRISAHIFWLDTTYLNKWYLLSWNKEVFISKKVNKLKLVHIFIDGLFIFLFFIETYFGLNAPVSN